MQKYPTAYGTVDLVIPKLDKSHIFKLYLLMGKRATEANYRFVGGFTDPEKDSSYEAAAIREGKEETSLDIAEVKYLTSTKIEDPRMKAPDCIITHLFLATKWSGEPKAADDIDELKWVDVLSPEFLDVVKEHLPLANYISNNLAKILLLLDLS